MIKTLSQAVSDATTRLAPSETIFLDELCQAMPTEENGFRISDLAWHGFREDEEHPAKLKVRPTDRLIARCEELFGGFTGKRLLELGPFEGEHSIGLSSLDPAELISIEANPYNFIKCLIVKQYYALDNVKFVLGDFVKFLETNGKKFDFILVAGVLYHLANPIRTLDMVLQSADAVGICTTVYKEGDCPFHLTGATREVEIEGQEPILLYERSNALTARGKKHGIGESAWLFTEEDLLRYLDFQGWEYVVFPYVRNPRCGPRVRMFARKKSI